MQRLGPRWYSALARRPAAALGVTLLTASIVIVIAVGARPGFDPYGWLVWGRQTLHLALDTNAAPSWKPLPYVFAVPYALFGRAQVGLWMVTACALSLSASVFAGRIAYRLTEAPADRRWAAWAAALFAGVSVLGINNYTHYTLSAQSDPMIVALVLAAVDCGLSGRRRWALACWLLASLGRPEAWPFLALYAGWLWRTDGALRPYVAASGILLLLLWFGIPAISSRSFFIAGDNAMDSGQAIVGNKLTGVLRRFIDMNATPVELAALLGCGFGLWRRDRRIIGLAAGAIVWLLVEIAFAYHGWPALQRYMFEAGAVLTVLAGVAVGRLLAAPPSFGRGFAGIGSIALVGVLAGSVVPTAVHRIQAEQQDLRALHQRATDINRLSDAIAADGGRARLLACGAPLTRLSYQTALAWTLRVNVSAVGFNFAQGMATGRPVVLFRAPSATHGWVIEAVHSPCGDQRSGRSG